MNPSGQGFGAAAVSIMPKYLITPATKAGRPVAGEVETPLNFIPTVGPWVNCYGAG